MRVIIDPAETLDAFADQRLKDFAKSRPKGSQTKQFVVKVADGEVAFLALDLIPNADHIVLYEMWVPKELRHKGIGSSILKELERIVKRLGYSKILVRPKPFEGDYPESILLQWYLKNGFKRQNIEPSILEKSVD